MSHRVPLIAFALALGVASTGCTVATDIGQPCFMVKKDPTGEQPSVRLQESEVGTGRDFISFGATECEDFACVRDASYQPAPGTPPTADAQGYCSRRCIPQSGTNPSLNNPCPSSNPSDDEDELLRFNCRSMILDAETLNLICAEDEARCRQIFGDNRTPFFCARGQDVQAG